MTFHCILTLKDMKRTNYTVMHTNGANIINTSDLKNNHQFSAADSDFLNKGLDCHSVTGLQKLYDFVAMQVISFT